jgi:para-nitrobenzyl esterase
MESTTTRKTLEGIKKCTAFSASPVQSKPNPFMFWSKEFLIPDTPIHEDCLYLNVWTGASADSKKPVLVYIYGGGFRSGGSACPIYDGKSMADKGIIFVSINYRVGVFGFLAHPELTKESNYNASGNYALLDMIAALKWVKQNIKAFGGDPDNVTIAGQSAGAFGVNYLTASPLTKGLIHRAIAESGGSFYTSPIRPSLDLKGAELMGIKFAETLHCKNISELRSKSADDILSAQGGLSGPIVDGYVLPSDIYDIYKNGKQNDIPIIVGWNENDKLFGSPKPQKYTRRNAKTIW